VPKPVPARNGALATVVGVEGVPEPRICVLFRWVEGRFLNATLTPRLLERVGVFTARLHEHTARFAPPDGFTRGEVDRVDDEWGAETLRRVGEARPEEDVATMRAAIRHIRAAIEPLGRGPDVYGLIHADLHQWNYLFHQGEVRAIDFDDCGYGHHLYDLGVTLFELQWHKNFDALRAALLAGYQSIRTLPVHHEAALMGLLMLRRIHMILWQVDSREHPAFREKWQAGVTYDIGKLQEALEG
jgi:Ser/Thr protein kinase RdoA (MazF antagonist)